MKPREYLFLADGESVLDAPSFPFVLCFCRLELSFEEARERVRAALAQEWPERRFRIGYLGVLSYDASQVDPVVGQQMAWFKKYDPVWLLGG